MNENIVGYIALTALATFLVCTWAFGRRAEAPKNEVGRYAWGRNGTAVLDTVDGTVYYLEGIGANKDEVPIVEVGLPVGTAWRKRGRIKDFGE